MVLENHYSDLSNLGGYPVELKLLKRRAEMLDAVSTGLHPSAVVGQLAEKHGVSETGGVGFEPTTPTLGG